MLRVFSIVFTLGFILGTAYLNRCNAENLPLGTLSVDSSAPIIRNIRIEIREVFDENNLKPFYRAVNKVKISTKEEVIRQELLFKEGDRFDSFLVAESERNLRALPFLRKIAITPIYDADYVDILVSTQDTWTLFPFINFSLGGGTKRQSVGIAETNLLGYGKRVEVLYAEDDGRQKVEGIWSDRRLFGTYQEMTVGLFSRSDGYRTFGNYGRRFRSLAEKYAWSVDVDSFDLVGQHFKDGEKDFIYRERRDAFSAGFTGAQGNPELLVRRYTLGYDYSSARYAQADAQDFEDVNVDPTTVSHDPEMLATDRKFSGPFVALQQIEPDFMSINFTDHFERVTDYNLGNDLYARVTYAAQSLGSDKDTLLVNLSDADGVRLSPTSFARGKAGVTSRMDTESIDNTLFYGDARYYNISGAKYWGRTYLGKYTFAASLSMDIGLDLDKDRQFLLGAGNGLRGYADRALTGSNTILLNLEERVHFVEDVFRLISIGGAAFFDIGGTGHQGVGDILNEELRSNVGVGLRIGFPRSSGGGVLRIDLALPLRDSPDGKEALEPRLLITAGQAVTAALPAESQQSAASNVTIKFLP